MEYCLFCDGIESSYQPKCEYVCSGCVILLCDAEQNDLRRAYQKATEHGIDRKAQALKMFIEKEELNVQRNNLRKFKRDNDRTRTVRTVRDQKEQIERFAV